MQIRLTQPRAAVVLAIVAPCLAATTAELESSFRQTVLPFVNTYCLACHAGANPAAQFNLKQYTSLDTVIRDHSRWALLAEKLANGDMPPKAMKQPPAAGRQHVIEWVESMRRSEAQKNAGDPGVVLLRRLSNAEYNYSIRDLTGVDIRPAKEFPVDPTNPSGFDNSGESLTMSPALLNKYLQAARDVSSHLVLKPAGFAFAPHPMLAESDREKYTIQRIVDFYDRQPTDYADYFHAAWKFKHRAALESPNATLESIARESKISANYLPMVWDILEEGPGGVGPVARLRAMWRMLPLPEHRQGELVRVGCEKMRDYVVKVRKLTARQFRSPKVEGLAGTSQPLMNWKLRAFAANRRDFDRASLQVEGEPPVELPIMPRAGGVPTEDQVGLRNAALAVRARFGDPDLIVPAGQRAAFEESFARFSNVFPDAFYIRERGRFYPDDSEDKGRLLSAGFHNVMGYFRDDTPLIELILDDEGRKELDTLWLEFDTIADFTTRTYVQFYYNQSGEIDGRGRESGSFRTSGEDVISEKVIFGIRDLYLAKAETGGDSLSKEAIREHFARVNARIREVEKARLEAEPSHLEAMLAFAVRAWRRPLAAAEREDLLAYYRRLRDKAGSGLSHDDAMREMIALVLMAPDFCYRVDAVPAPPPPDTKPVRVSRRQPPPAAPQPKTQPLTGQALASRLSFLLWSSLPDKILLDKAVAGDLHNPEVLAAEVRRMLKDKRSLALATEFSGNWLDFRRFEDHASVDRGRFPEFTSELRQAMFEEPIHFIDDLIRNDGSMLDLLYGTHTFVNRILARHYGITDQPRRRSMHGEWFKVEDARRYGRGGLLPMAAFLTRNSPGLRTSPVKRGYWVAKTLLGEAIPPPPPSVPELPNDEAAMDLPLRQALVKHRDNPACAGCHARFDGFGLAFEGYGPVGEHRTRDLAGRPVDTKADFPGGTSGDGVNGLVAYVRANREKDFVNNLCRKLLAYALGRGLLLSDEPLVDSMKAAFQAGGHRFSVLIESIVVSPQFLNQRTPDVSANRQVAARKGEK
jgi:mono/diheme cytochrome c family protein